MVSAGAPRVGGSCPYSGGRSKHLQCVQESARRDRSGPAAPRFPSWKLGSEPRLLALPGVLGALELELRALVVADRTAKDGHVVVRVRGRHDLVEERERLLGAPEQAERRRHVGAAARVGGI